jgi:hypothetical protein
MNKFYLLAFFAVSVLFSCENKNENKQNNTPPKSEVVKNFVAAPSFVSDSAYFFIEKQLSFGARTPNSQAHIACGDFLVKTLESYGAKVDVQSFEVTAHDGKILKGRNIFASFFPEKNKRILLGAHWDTRPWADNDTNDGASGVAVLLEIARVLSVSPQKPTVGTDIIFFDLEDYGSSGKADSYCYGSQHWAKNKGNYTAFYGILLDMVGGKNALFTKEGKSMEYAPSVADNVWNIAQKLGYGNLFLMQQTDGIIDDHVYVSETGGFPMIDIINYSPEPQNRFGDFWHTHKDNIEVIDKNTLKAVGETVLHTLYNEPNNEPN